MSEFDELESLNDSIDEKIEELGELGELGELTELSDDELLEIIKKNDEGFLELKMKSKSINDVSDKKKVIISEKEIYYNSLKLEDYISIDNQELKKFMSAHPFNLFNIGKSLTEFVNMPNIK